MTALAEFRPRGVDAYFRPGNAANLELNFEAGTLTGRTFTATLNGVAMDVTVAGDTLSLSATAAQTAAITSTAAWVLTEELPGDDVVLLVGTWAPSDRPGVSDTTVVEVTAASAAVDVTVLPTSQTVASNLINDTYRDTNETGLAVSPLEITPVPLTVRSVADLPFAVELRGRGTVTHSVASSLVGLAVGPVGATINQELDLVTGMTGVPGAGPTLYPLGRLPAHSPGDYQLFAWSFTVGTAAFVATPTRQGGIGVYRA